MTEADLEQSWWCCCDDDDDDDDSDGLFFLILFSSSFFDIKGIYIFNDFAMLQFFSSC